jgi:hypothetical protein
VRTCISVCILVHAGVCTHSYSHKPRPLNSAGLPGVTSMTSSGPLEQPLACLNLIPTEPSLSRVILTALPAGGGGGGGTGGGGCSLDAGGGGCLFVAGAGVTGLSAEDAATTERCSAHCAALCARYSSMAFRIAWFATSVFACNSVPHIGARLLTARWASILALSNVCPVCAEQCTHRAHATSNTRGQRATGAGGGGGRGCDRKHAPRRG